MIKSLLVESARRAGRQILELFDKGIEIEFKGAVDLVTEADRAAEKLIVDMIHENFPDHSVLAEEEGGRERGSDHRWIIDPLDGTTNFAHGFPWFAVSIGYQRRDKLLLGVVYNPCSDELFLAERGQGASLNGRPLRVSATTMLQRALLATGFPYDRKESTVNNYDHFVNLQQAAQACRRPGAASLDLACVAAGRFDGYWEMKLKPWDLAAGTLLVEEAGGRVTDFDGLPMLLDRGECLASNGLIHDEMQTVLQYGRRPPVAGF